MAFWEKGAYLSYGGGRAYVKDPFSSDASSISSDDFPWGIDSPDDLLEERRIPPLLKKGKNGKNLKKNGQAYADKLTAWSRERTRGMKRDRPHRKHHLRARAGSSERYAEHMRLQCKRFNTPHWPFIA